MSRSGASRPVEPVRPSFIAAFTFAQIGAFISFMPLIQVLLPLKAAALDPAQKALVLSQTAFWGALTASVANLLAGAISDRTTSRFGRRRPWLLIGLVGTLMAYVAIMLADSRLELILGVIGFQLAFNMLFAALLALLPDRVPDAQKGRVAAFLSLGHPIGAVAGAVLVGGLLASEASRYAAIGVVLVLAIAPFALRLKDPPITADATERFSLVAFLKGLWVDPRKHPDFALAWVSRFMVLVAITLTQCYMLYYLQDALNYPALFPGRRAEQGLALLTTVATVANVGCAMIFGMLSDRLGRRKLFAAGAAMILAAAMVTFSLTPGWTVVLAGFVVFGCGAGCYYAVDIALVSQVLPSQDDAGKDLGVINLANTLPQALAPVLAVWFLGPSRTDYHSLFLVAAGLAMAGGLAILPIRGVR
ncbi:MFS transporter [Caulobacter sp. CCNWLY153]|uniref:MFS transporter n=1 Tax=unclassified Caulobacter TaxID=2648921 RepID=UPI002FF3B20B